MLTTTTLHSPGDHLLIDLSKTIGQESALAALGLAGPCVEIRVTCPSQTFEGTGQILAGFGRARCLGPLGGHEVLYTDESIVRVLA